MGGQLGGVAGWLMKKWRRRPTAQARLTLLDRIALAPRQTLALVEAEGRHILVATSGEGGPVFYPLDENNRTDGRLRPRVLRARPATARRAGVSW